MRRSGLLLHISSLPSQGPIGDLGPEAHRLLDWLERAGCRTWQVLPLNVLGPGHSPYASPSAFAAESSYLSLEVLADEGLLERVEAPGPAGSVDWNAVATWKRPLLERAGLSLWQQDGPATETWAAARPWAGDWALYRALREVHGPLSRWPRALRHRDPDALGRATDEHQQAIRIELALQRLFDRQWSALRGAAHARGIELLGDIPLFVSGGSCETWSRPDLFGLDEHGEATWRAGVPPDYFTPDGQLWGNPHYDWDAHRAEHWAWWKARMARCLEQVDRVRLDHFRGLVAAWAVPPGAETAATGEWIPGPGGELLDALGDAPLIAEDLGTIDAGVEALRDERGLAGMKILQFAFSDDSHHPFLPHTWSHPRWVAYTGTHDNDTVRGWYDTSSERTRHRYRLYTGRDGHDVAWDLIRLAWSSVAQDAIAPLQDVLNLGAEARMNTPGTVEGNWSWRIPWPPPGFAADRLRGLAKAYGRLPPEP